MAFFLKIVFSLCLSSCIYEFIYHFLADFDFINLFTFFLYLVQFVILLVWLDSFQPFVEISLVYFFIRFFLLFCFFFCSSVFMYFLFDHFDGLFQIYTIFHLIFFEWLIIGLKLFFLYLNHFLVLIVGSCFNGCFLFFSLVSELFYFYLRDQFLNNFWSWLSFLNIYVFFITVFITDVFDLFFVIYDAFWYFISFMEGLFYRFFSLISIFYHEFIVK